MAKKTPRRGRPPVIMACPYNCGIAPMPSFQFRAHIMLCAPKHQQKATK